MPVAILCGGLATRMHPLTLFKPKSMIEVTGVPFIKLQLDQLERQGVEEVVLCLGHMGDQIYDYVTRLKTNLIINFSDDDPEHPGTAGAIRNALPLLGKQFFIMYGDSYLLCDFARVQFSFFARKSKAMLTVYYNGNQFEQSNVELISSVGEWILRYDKTKPTKKMKHVDYGLGVMCSWVLEEYCQELSDLADVYGMLSRNNVLLGHEIHQRYRYYEIGSMKGLADFEWYLEEKRNDNT